MYYTSKQNSLNKENLLVKSFPNKNAIKEMARITQSERKTSCQKEAKENISICDKKQEKPCKRCVTDDIFFLATTYLALFSQNESESDIIPELITLLSILF